jgi:hypothetical protein
MVMCLKIVAYGITVHREAGLLRGPTSLKPGVKVSRSWSDVLQRKSNSSQQVPESRVSTKMAAIYARLGKKDRALEWLERAYRDAALNWSA